MSTQQENLPSGEAVTSEPAATSEPRGSATTVSGTVIGLHRWPVKSLRGESLSTARFDERGMAGDRAFALFDERPNRPGTALTVRQTPAMLGWAADYADAADTADPEREPVLTAPDGARWAWSSPELDTVLRASLDIPLRAHAAPGKQDRGPTVLVTFEASRTALRTELGADVDLARFRTNLHVRTDLPPFAEQGWQHGDTLTAGGVTLTVTGKGAGPCVRCAVPSWDSTGSIRWRALQSHIIDQHANLFGVIMRVTEPGVIRRADPVQIVPAAC